MCAQCRRTLRKPGVEVQIADRTLVLGPVCAGRLLGKPKRRESVIPRTLVVRVQQAELFGEVA